MPRKKEIPEYNKPEIVFIRKHYTPRQIQERANQLCAGCINHPCNLLPVTTKGEECPYFKERQNVES